MVAVIQPRIDLLRAALGRDAAARVQFVDMAEIGRNPARIIPAWRAFIEEHGAGGRPVRGIGEPIWARPPRCGGHRVPDARGAAQPRRRAARPAVVALPVRRRGAGPGRGDRGAPQPPRPGRRRGLPGQRPVRRLAPRRHRLRLRPAASSPPRRRRRTFASADLGAVREDVVGHARQAGVPAERTADLALALHEVAANSVEHGHGEGRPAHLARGRRAGVRDPRRRPHQRPAGRADAARVGRRGRPRAVAGQPALRPGAGALRRRRHDRPRSTHGSRAETFSVLEPDRPHPPFPPRSGPSESRTRW